jgi:hypothetical protein
LVLSEVVNIFDNSATVFLSEELPKKKSHAALNIVLYPFVASITCPLNNILGVFIPASSFYLRNVEDK